MYLVDEVMYLNENHIRIYLVGRQFDVETTDGTAFVLTKELLFPYFEMKKLKTEEITQVVAA